MLNEMTRWVVCIILFGSGDVPKTGRFIQETCATRAKLDVIVFGAEKKFVYHRITMNLGVYARELAHFV